MESDELLMQLKHISKICTKLVTLGFKTKIKN